MKLLHATVNTLSDREFNKVSNYIADSIYKLDPEIRSIYEIHIDMIDGNWHIEFVPTSKVTPVLKVNTYVSYNDDNREVLHITPNGLVKFPDNVTFRDYESAIDAVTPYNVIADLIVELFDFEYVLS